jgi:integrase
MTVLTLADMIAVYQNTAISMIIDIPWAYDAVNLLYRTGCRPNEIFTTPRFTVLNETTYQLNTSKKNLPRYFPKSLFLEYQRELIESGNAPMAPYSERRLLMYWRRYNPSAQAFVEDKPIQLYMMRHIYIKQLYDDGLNTDEIAAVMGYSTDTVVLGYVNSVVYTI